MKGGDTEAGRNEDVGSPYGDLPLGQRKTRSLQLLNHQVPQAVLGPGPCRGH